ncbi:FAD-dependent oxidoreductase [Paraflavitalea pollutisoli]|uniref:FAD-dependent oxidoreductase n=1 Tax=Paraflavitalea pollutisoli TaxID=3034143 RepID=UPI0023ECB532|nr:FAD-binding protein [Paraflavitalea sp. H1-2-19X]
MSCENLKQQATASNFKPALEVVLPADSSYDASRAICNARFDLKPCAIAFCQTEEHIAFCLRYAASNGVAIRIRSGGHHHEGMSSANDAMVIDVSKMNGPIRFLPDHTAWIPAGKQLGDDRMPGTVYQEVTAAGLIFPGGTCESVHIGGLLPGGGWGFSSRMYGLTCDCLVEAIVVLPNGQTVSATAHNEYSDLFWALQGGGGGNFGVVSQYRVQLYPITTTTWQFILAWSPGNMKPAVDRWLALFTGRLSDLDARFYTDAAKTRLIPSITCSMRLNVVADINDPKAETAVMASVLYGTENDVNDFLSGFLTPAITPVRQFIENLSTKQTSDPAITCGGQKRPHKISSCFPIDTGNWDRLSDQLTDYILNRSVFVAGVSKYINLQSMGGKISEIGSNDTAFPYRDKPFLMQMQVWWDSLDPAISNPAIQWVADFRDHLALTDQQTLIPLIEGAFLNFPDKDMDRGADIKTIAGRLQWLKHYYADNLNRLQTIKTKYDPANLLQFEMGIPLYGLTSFAAIVCNDTNNRQQQVFMTNQAGAMMKITCTNGQWDSHPTPIPLSDKIPATKQLIAASSRESNSRHQKMLLLDTTGKVWEVAWNEQSSAPKLTSLVDYFLQHAKSPIRWMSCQVDDASETDRMTSIVTSNNTLVVISEMNGQWIGGNGNEWVNIPNEYTEMAQCSTRYRDALHAFVLEAGGTIWYRYSKVVEYSNNEKMYTKALDALHAHFPNLPVTGAKHIACATDSSAVARIVIVDTSTQADLWYMEQPPNGNWNYNPVNIQSEIIKGTPAWQRVVEFTGISVILDTRYNELHVYAQTIGGLLYHTLRSSSGNWAAMDLVPTE